MTSTPHERGDSAADSSGEQELMELFRLAGVSHVAQLPLDIERDIHRFLRRAGPAIVGRLASGLADRDPMTRMKVVTYLGQVASPSCVGPLVTGLKDVDPRVRFLAVVSLRDCGELAAVDSLLGVLDDDDDRVRGAAADALSRLTNAAHDCNPFATATERAEAIDRLSRWWGERRDLPRMELLAAGFRARGYDVADLGSAGADGLVEALGDSLPFVHKNAQLALAALTNEHRTLEDELRRLDHEGEREYSVTRAEALAKLRKFYRDAVSRHAGDPGPG